MNNPKNKKRPSLNRGGRGKSIEPEFPVDGIYANYSFLHSVGMLLGLPVQLLTKNKEMYEGVLTSFNPNFEVVLDWPHLVSYDDSSIISNLESVKKKLVFKSHEIVYMKVINVDPDYAIKENFAIDSAISKSNGLPNNEKELEPWSAEGTDYDNIDLGDSSSPNGWNADEMFRKNEEKYGVVTTYTPDMEGYTIPLQKKNTEEWKEQEARAKKIAAEIEKSPMTQSRSELENGDEEERFSAVVRPNVDSSHSSGKYRPPQRRKIHGEPSDSGKPPRVTPPPQGPISGGRRYNTPMQHPYNEGNHPLHHAGSGPSPSYSQSNQHYHQYSNPKPQPSTQKHVSTNQTCPGPPTALSSSQRDSKINGEAKDLSRSASEEPTRESSLQKESFTSEPPPPAVPGVPLHPYSSHHQPPPPHHHHHHHMHPQHASSHPPPHSHSLPPPQTHSQESVSRKSMHHPDKEQHIASFKSFGRDFKLAEGGGAGGVEKKGNAAAVQGGGPPPGRGSHHNINNVNPPQQAVVPSQQLPPMIQKQSSPPTISTPSDPQSGGAAIKPTPSSTDTKDLSTAPASSAPVAVRDAPKESISASIAESDTAKAPPPPSAGVPASKLNPNAKEFVFNPNAKPFSPRSPSTSTPPRAQTPQIAAPSPAQQVGSASGIAAVGYPPQNMVPTYMVTNQPFQVPCQPRFQKRSAVSNPRAEYVSSIQVAAATGTPILASTPLTPISAPQSAAIHRMPLSQNVPPPAPQAYPYQGMPMMLPFHHHGIPMVTTMVPTSVGMYYHQGAEGQQQNAAQQTMYVPAAPPHQQGGQQQAAQQHANAGLAHPGQPPTPQSHSGPGIPQQPPTPGPTPPQALIYGPPPPSMTSQHLPSHSGQVPHSHYPNHNPAAIATAHHHPAPGGAQLVMIPQHMTPHVMGHSGSGPTPSSGAPFTSTSAPAAIQPHVNPAHPVQYIQGGTGGGPPVHQIPVVHPNP